MNRKLIIGSHAAKYWFPEFRIPNDLDEMSEVKIMTEKHQTYWFGDSSEYLLEINRDSKYIDPDNLYNLKMAHMGWSIHWNKTASDVLFLKSKGCKRNDKLYNMLFKDFTRIHGKQWATLKGKDSKTFFEDNVKRKYIHDDIHDAIAVYDKPLYTRILGDGVMCSKDQFFELSDEDKILLVKEETWVTALERYLIPSNFTCGSGLAYFKSLKKLITTMSGAGYFKHWMIDNYEKIHKDNDTTYIQKFKEAEAEGRLRLA
jgi:hypothetical protein